MSYHDPVLLEECLEGLHVNPSGLYVDVTFGGGGHSKAILEQLTTGKLYAFDQDPDAKANLPEHPNLVFIAANFRYIKNHLRLHGVQNIDGILADLGVSSHQFDEGGRGFSIRFDGPLDMRMNPSVGMSAAEVLQTYQEQALYDLFRKHTDIKGLRPLINALLMARANNPLTTTAALRELCEPLAPRGQWHKYVAQVFQGLRMEVNSELEALEDMLYGAIDVLKPSGRLVVMSYHSLEDRMVKNFIKEGKALGQTDSDFFGVKHLPLKAITRKPIVSSAQENAKNPRATSAKLRIAERTHTEWRRDE
ncbi:MAG: 16S rRNA (cytosine(1402)-N(4))-methyltransferase [Flavobacteriales bacterium]|jgi:16S rRNA (cytosine1402-N4)-methyltransferase|nr:16S rRNA (cytosine(1402)-N(4))-methyltransferase [Flavobacteriales bacterium]|tara:strand:+ start:605 stop:1525 length:921 start_codon:yes stop_codon:yes gene_type:complete